MNNLLNPASPISPLNPINPLNPSHDYLFNTRTDTVAEVAVAKQDSVSLGLYYTGVTAGCIGCFILGIAVCLIFKKK